MQIIKDKKELSYICRQIKQSKAKISFVPTMGMIHNAHLSLIAKAKDMAEIVIVSIFVNPKQFDNNNDFVKYPRNLIEDQKKLQNAGVDYIFIPETDKFYSEDFAFNIEIHKLADLLCGATRPGHMNGVCVVLIKLFNLIRPDFVMMGEKDYQQLYITKKLVEDFELDTEIISCPTIRENSGLAMSSRNERLSDQARNQIAPKLKQNLESLKQEIIKNEYKEISHLIKKYWEKFIKDGFSKIDYLEILNSNLTKYDSNTANTRIFIAVWLEDVRLIDNISL
jgi:pantoate--beta-alanine ligase